MLTLSNSDGFFITLVDFPNIFNNKILYLVSSSPSPSLYVIYFQIGLGDFVPGTQIGKNTDDGERQANQMKLYVSFLYLLGQKHLQLYFLTSRTKF